LSSGNSITAVRKEIAAFNGALILSLHGNSLFAQYFTEPSGQIKCWFTVRTP
jgi:hypothetical protein